MDATSIVAEIVSKVAARFEIEGAPVVVDSVTAHKAADALSYVAPYNPEAVNLAAHAARRIGWGEKYHAEALDFAKRAEEAFAAS